MHQYLVSLDGLAKAVFTSPLSVQSRLGVTAEEVSAVGKELTECMLFDESTGKFDIASFLQKPEKRRQGKELLQQDPAQSDPQISSTSGLTMTPKLGSVQSVKNCIEQLFSGLKHTMALWETMNTQWILSQGDLLASKPGNNMSINEVEENCITSPELFRPANQDELRRRKSFHQVPLIACYYLMTRGYEVHWPSLACTAVTIRSPLPPIQAPDRPPPGSQHPKLEYRKGSISKLEHWKGLPPGDARWNQGMPGDAR